MARGDEIDADGSSDSIDFVDTKTPIAFLLHEATSEGPELKIPIYPRSELQVGRDENICQHVIPNPHVSKRHFRIYSIIYELDKASDLQPLIYCEDLESTNGTFINDQCVGMISHERVGHLLTHGDIIEIKPHWRFRFHQPYHSGALRDVEQLRDLQRFEETYSVTDRVLGKGHYGSVFLAQELSTHKQLACKIVNLEKAAREMAENAFSGEDDPEKRWLDHLHRKQEGRTRVLREIKILSKLSHPNIINLRKAFCSDESLYIFTELAPGGDLFSYIEAHDGSLHEWHCRVIARQIVLAIEYMHAKGVVHRDIKPENVLIMQTEFGGRVVLTDFGFANNVSSTTGRLMSRLGTEGFIAPEVENVESKKVGYTTAADMWSLGVLTACLLTGTSLVPRDELSQLSQVQVAERFLGMDNSYVRNQWQYMPRRALSFLRDLLVIEPDRRITAKQALDHDWLKKPASEAACIEEGYKRIIRFWKRRQTDDNVIEDLPSRSNHVGDQESQGSKSRRKLPDTTMSPYFNLDRHLQQRDTSKRRNILDDLTESGSLFLTAEDPSELVVVANTLTTRNVSIKTVPGNNLFNYSYQHNSSANRSAKISGAEATPRTALPNSPYCERVSIEGPDDEEESNGKLSGSTAITRGTSPSSKRRRRQESEDDELKKMPKFASAKAYSDELRKLKGEKGRSVGDSKDNLAVAM